MNIRVRSRRQFEDLCTGTLLLVISVAMVAYSIATMPLAGTYAGVSNAWFVSPALMPISIGTLLTVLSISLVRQALKKEHDAVADDAAQEAYAFSVRGLIKGNLELLAAAAAIIAFVFGYLPRVDFVVTTTAFLLVVTMRFHVHDCRFGGPIFTIYLVAGLALWVLGALGIQTGIRTSEGYILDAIAAGASLCAMLLVVLGTSEAGKRNAWQCVWIAAIFPLLLTAVFKFGLRVPMPREGLIVNLMDQAFFTLRIWFR